MTVPYGRPITRHCGLPHLLFTRWRGSIFKLVWPDYLIFLTIYFLLSVVYRFYLTPAQQKVFIQIAKYSDTYSAILPVSFVLGFYVSIIVKRWWEQFLAIPWIDGIALILSVTIPAGHDEQSRLIRRTIVRQVCLAITQCFILISPRVKRRFPTLQHLVAAGLLLENEKSVYQKELELTPEFKSYPSFWIPISWACSNVARGREQGVLRTDAFIKQIIDELNQVRNKCTILTGYDLVNIPLAYTQVVTLAVYAYFLACLFSRQWTPTSEAVSGKFASSGRVLEDLDLIFPFFTTLQFFFFVGWLRVAESLLNPFGDDDDDIELNWMVDRNLQVGYAIVDQAARGGCPEVVRDPHWEKIVPENLPHTIASKHGSESVPVYSTESIFVSAKNAEIWNPESPANAQIQVRKVRPEPSRKTIGNFWTTRFPFRTPRKRASISSRERDASDTIEQQRSSLIAHEDELITITTTS